MVPRRSASMIAALCATIVWAGAPVASAQLLETGARTVVTELPVLSELPPLPAEGEPSVADEKEDPDTSGMSGVQTVALALAAAVLVAGGTGLALVTRRGRGEQPDEPPPQTGPLV